ncbi:hypothetical protein [Natrinema altunense]|uniref:Uncharacterized protein n=1 Tax=Natrinema altunense (strain JCM 12890 / CGMCC 1.3731 / AJ2) TaxID=1227494 RepID=L9ZNA1_NATA2|nr:hypothetical protein [Natrinema altunense]ELY86638.1 hypothetical protein C485_06967 [Natrinema altunense JCM 12890]
MCEVGAGPLVATASCLQFFESDDPTRRFGPDELEPILAMDVPTVARPAPVQPGENAVTDAVGRLEELIAAVPDPIGADDVPNEAVRHDIDRAREIARHRRDALAGAMDGFHRMRRSIHARRYAGEAAVAFEAVTDDRSLNDVETEREAVTARLEQRRSGITHRGTDLQRTLLLGAHRESELATAGRWLGNRPRHGTNGALVVGELGGAVEQARAAMAFSDELERRHEARLTDARSFESQFETALERSLDAIDAADVPDRSTDLIESVDADISGTIAERVLHEGAIALSRASEQTVNKAADGETAAALRTACAFERDRRAFERIRKQVEDGAHRTLETVDDVRDVRESAVEIAADVPFSPDEPSLGGDLLADGYNRLEQLDGQIRDLLHRDWETSLEHEYALYVVIGAQLEAIPDGISAFDGRLEE